MENRDLGVSPAFISMIQSMIQRHIRRARSPDRAFGPDEFPDLPTVLDAGDRTLVNAMRQYCQRVKAQQEAMGPGPSNNNMVATGGLQSRSVPVNTPKMEVMDDEAMSGSSSMSIIDNNSSFRLSGPKITSYCSSSTVPMDVYQSDVEMMSGSVSVKRPLPDSFVQQDGAVAGPSTKRMKVENAVVRRNEGYAVRASECTFHALFNGPNTPSLHAQRTIIKNIALASLFLDMLKGVKMPGGGTLCIDGGGEMKKVIICGVLDRINYLLVKNGLQPCPGPIAELLYLDLFDEWTKFHYTSETYP